jgi:ATP-dependent DNA helicase RecG
VSYRQRHLFEAQPELAVTKTEDHWFDRKSVRVDPAALANLLVGFANADGGTVVIGVEKDGEVTGIDAYTEHVNTLRRTAIDFTSPPVRHTADVLPCTTSRGRPDHLLVIEVHPSDQLHRNHRGEVYRRIGDQTRRLGDEDARELAFDKGERPFDGLPVPDAALSDLDPLAVQAFAGAIGAGTDGERALRVRGLVTERDGRPAVTWGALLLFGTHPQSFLPGATIRILRYEGLRPQPGTRSNLVFDRRVDGPLPAQIEAARQVMLNQLRQVTRLTRRAGSS